HGEPAKPAVDRLSVQHIHATLSPRPPSPPHGEEESHATSAHQGEPISLDTSVQALPRLEHVRKSSDRNGREFSDVFLRITISRLTGDLHPPPTSEGHGWYGEQQVAIRAQTAPKFFQDGIQVNDVLESLHGRDSIQASPG